MVNVGLEARHQTVCLEILIHHQPDDSKPYGQAALSNDKTNKIDNKWVEVKRCMPQDHISKISERAVVLVYGYACMLFSEKAVGQTI